LLAGRLGYACLDTDQAVVERFGGMTIRAVFAAHGEAAFRDAECAEIEALLRRTDQVIATGGGLPMQPRAQHAIRAATDAATVYLAAQPEILHRRIVDDAATAPNRPRLTQVGGDLEEVRTVLSQRDPTYRALADHVIDVNEATPERIADQIMARLETPDP